LLFSPLVRILDIPVNFPHLLGSFISDHYKRDANNKQEDAENNDNCAGTAEQPSYLKVSFMESFYKEIPMPLAGEDAQKICIHQSPKGRSKKSYNCQ
jgi:hypothetical protein